MRNFLAHKGITYFNYYFFKLFLLFLIHIPICFQAEASYGHNSIITMSIRSSRCDYLAKRRKDKLEVKKKLMSLLLRNKKLRNITPLNKKKIIKKLINLHYDLRHELKLAKLNIESIQEKIIKSGCPGLNLQDF